MTESAKGAALPDPDARSPDPRGPDGRGPDGRGPDGLGNPGHSGRMVVVVLALAAGFAIVPRVTKSCDTSSSAQNDEAPDFTANVVANPREPAEASITLSALRGHPVLLDFWATWCGPCQAESPIVNRISERFKDKGLVVIGVNTNDVDGLAAKFAARKGLSFPIVYDVDDRIAHRYGVGSLPTLIVISKEGKIVAVRNVTGESELERLVRQVL